MQTRAAALGQGKMELCLVLWLHSERQHLGNTLFLVSGVEMRVFCLLN